VILYLRDFLSAGFSPSAISMLFQFLAKSLEGITKRLFEHVSYLFFVPQPELKPFYEAFLQPFTWNTSVTIIITMLFLAVLLKKMYGTTKAPRMLELYQLLNMQGIQGRRIALWRGQENSFLAFGVGLPYFCKCTASNFDFMLDHYEAPMKDLKDIVKYGTEIKQLDFDIVLIPVQELTDDRLVKKMRQLSIMLSVFDFVALLENGNTLSPHTIYVLEVRMLYMILEAMPPNGVFD
jgi:hypothetical protein